MNFSGVLHNNAGVVDGVGVVQFSGMTTLASLQTCLPSTPIKVHGTLDSARHLMLTSESVHDTVFTLNADVPTDLSQEIPTGSVTSSGTCGTFSGDSRPQFASPVRGTFTGSEKPALASAANTTNPGSGVLVATETDPDPTTGQSVITGTLTMKLDSCSVDLPISIPRIGALVMPVLQLTTPTPIVNLEGASGNVIVTNVMDLGTDCKGQPLLTTNRMDWIGSLTKQ